jgi:membrane-bound serine protease (ClpP class)
VLGALALSAVVLTAGAAAARGTGATVQPGGRRGITVLQLQGYLDPPVAALALRTLTQANRARTSLVLIQLDSNGVVATDVAPLVQAIQRSRVPVVVWVGPSGAHAQGGAALVAEAAPVLFVAQGSDLGPATPTRLDQPGATSNVAVRAELARLARTNRRDPTRAEELTTTSIGATVGAAIGVTNGARPTLGEVVVTLDGQRVRTSAGVIRLSTATVTGKGTGRRRQPNQEVVFASLGLGARVQHALISPRLAYLLFVVGLALIVFEFFAASVGLGSAIGAVCLVSSCYGFSHLPLAVWAAALVGLAIGAFGIDVQAGQLGPWTAIATAALVGGSLTLYGGSSRLDVPWWELALVVLSTLAFFVAAVPAFVRARFSTPTIGREGLIGELGQAEVAVDPDGVVVIRGSRWRARANRATPIGVGAPARVVAVEGLVLEVEPEEGAARDYRDRARSRSKRRGESDPG